jgi:plasmid segregation protein ParM
MGSVKKTALFKLGLDIGYSNCKISMGFDDQDQPQVTKVIPVGAATIDKLPQSTNGRNADDVLQVLVDDEKWLAGIEPARLQGWVRFLSENYPSSFCMTQVSA